MDEPTYPFNPDTPTGHVPPSVAGAAEESVHQTDSSPDVTQESPGGPSVVPSASGTGPTSPTAFGRYAVRRSLGAGGFGEVYLGHDTLLDRPVAIKWLRPESTALLSEGAPALQEARTLAHLSHPGIVAIHDVGVHAGQMYVVSLGAIGCAAVFRAELLEAAATFRVTPKRPLRELSLRSRWRRVEP